MLTKQIGGALPLVRLTVACAREGSAAHLSYKIQDVAKNGVLMEMSTS